MEIKDNYSKTAVESQALAMPAKRRTNMSLIHAATKEADNWILTGLIEAGDQVLIAGAPKAGKSLMASQISLAVASGGRWLKWSAPKPLKVVYVNLEIRRKSFGRRVEAQIGGWQNVVHYENNFCAIDEFKTIDVMNSVERKDLIEIIKEDPPDLVVFDVLARMHNVDEMTPEMKAVLMALRVIAGDAASIVVHHARKAAVGLGNVSQTATDIRGSSAIHGEVDTTMVLTRRAGQGARFALTFTARNVEAPDELLLNIDDSLKFYEADKDEEDKLKNVMQKLFGNGQTILATKLNDDIRNMYDITSRSRASDYIKQSVNSGMIKRERNHDGKYYYSPVENGPILTCVK